MHVGRVILLHSFFSLVNRLSILRARRKTGYIVARLGLCVPTHVSLHLGGPLRQDQLMCSSTAGVQQDPSYKSLVNFASRGVMESHISDRHHRIRFTARPD
jgi:hypothetical protein